MPGALRAALRSREPARRDAKRAVASIPSALICLRRKIGSSGSSAAACARMAGTLSVGSLLSVRTTIAIARSGSNADGTYT